MITVVAMPLATSPALYPPMPSASTTSPWFPSDAIESSLWDLTIPGSVQLATSSAPDKVMMLRRSSQADVDAGADRRGGRAPHSTSQGTREFFARLVTLARVLSHRLVQECDQGRREGRVVLQNIRRMLVGNPVHRSEERRVGKESR